MKLSKISYILCFFCLSLSVKAQRAPASEGNLMMQLEESLRSGKKKSLRDLGSLLDKPDIGGIALDVLRRYTMFTSDEINLSKKISKADFLAFYYNNESDFQYSDLTGNYYLSSLEDRKVNRKIENLELDNTDQTLSLFHQAEEAINGALDSRNEKELIRQINALKKLNLPEVQQYVLQLSIELSTINQKKWSSEVYQAINKALVYAPDIRSIKIILSLLSENKITKADALPSLALISNIAIPKDKDARYITQKYNFYIDSLETLDNIRMYGYEMLFNFQPSFFENIADYFGRVLCFANGREWLVHNATSDLVKTTHSRALFYMAAVGVKNQYHYPDVDFNFAKAVQTIRNLTHINLGVENEKGAITFLDQSEADRQSCLNYLTYWATSYDDYEWDASRDMFVNKHQALEKTQHYERLFRRLNSRNDSVAMASFKQLTEGDPGEIISLANKYRQMFRSYNQTLPPFKYKYLEQLSELTLFCRRYEINYEANKKLKQQLKTLSLTSSQAERYTIENEIIAQISVADITALEYWACIHQENPENNFSVGRILDIFYSTHWNEILNDDLQLRLFLKKADLFKSIGVIGVCNTYLSKFDMNKRETVERLRTIKKEEADDHILNQITQLVQDSEMEETSAFSDFIENPLYFDKRDIKILAPPTINELQQIIQLIQNEEENGIIGKYFFYLRLHPTLESVPYLMNLAANDRVIAKKRGKIVTLGDQVTPILESIFSYTLPATSEDKIFDIAPWLDKWKADKDSYKQWPKKFFEEKMTFLEDQKELTIEDINLITESPNYDTSYRHFCLKSLLKVKPVKSIRSLSIEPKLSITRDLHYFETFEFSYKQLDDIPKLFNIDDPQAMLNFLIKRAEIFDIDKKGSFYNNMFRHVWFSAYINSGKADLVTVAYIQQVLETYLGKSEYMSEYEEQITTLHIAQLQNIGKPLEERLLAPFDLNADITAKAKIQETIISTIAYDEIGTVAKYFQELTTTLGPEPWAFLHRDFGLPVFDLTDKEAYISFRRNLTNMTEYEVYVHYLKEFGIDFLNKEGELDYEKIVNILRFDSVTPFVGGGGGKRDYHTYGVIKLLELSFGTRQGFHEKLNENQNFYTFSTVKRSKAWINYLLDKNLILIPEDQAPSFNKLME